MSLELSNVNISKVKDVRYPVLSGEHLTFVLKKTLMPLTSNNASEFQMFLILERTKDFSMNHIANLHHMHVVKNENEGLLA